jgi:hypothetical protein
MPTAGDFVVPLSKRNIARGAILASLVLHCYVDPIHHFLRDNTHIGSFRV